jgi:hypothetical protein
MRYSPGSGWSRDDKAGKPFDDVGDGMDDDHGDSDVRVVRLVAAGLVLVVVVVEGFLVRGDSRMVMDTRRSDKMSSAAIA